MLTLLFVLIAYLLGSIPSAVWVGKVFYQKDVRDFGSKNAGATNTFRVLGVRAGVPVMLMDVAKGYLAAYLANFIPGLGPSTPLLVTVQLGLGLMAVIGHIFPVFASFKGGKGIATLLGMVLAIQFWPGVICIGLFIFILTLTQYVSLSSVVTAVAYPIIIILVFRSTLWSLNVFSVLVAGLVLYTHRENIKRLLAHTESKVFFLRKKPST